MGLCAFVALSQGNAQTLANQANDPTVLRQIIIFGRHGVRSAVAPAALSRHLRR
jgi:hypothetical protein